MEQQAKIKRFLDDKAMSAAVKEIILATFLKKKPVTDVQMLAASRIAIDLLDEAYKELEKYAVIQEDKERELTQPGL